MSKPAGFGSKGSNLLSSSGVAKLGSALAGSKKVAPRPVNKVANAATKSSKSTSKKGAKKQKIEKYPGKPKKPGTAYFAWMNDNREKIKAKYGISGIGDVSKKAGELWKQVDADVKKKYEDAHHRAMEQWYKQMEAMFPDFKRPKAKGTKRRRGSDDESDMSDSMSDSDSDSDSDTPTATPPRSTRARRTCTIGRVYTVRTKQERHNGMAT